MVCDLCPRKCGVLRDDTHGEGRCGMPALPVVARAALHHWEEPPLSGTRGAGAVFFSGCSLGCVFCQNHPISHENFGKTISADQLSSIFQSLIHQGAHNIDLVNPTHFSHVLAEVLCKPLPVPVVWNSGGYDRPEVIATLGDKVDVWLPDLKYLSPHRAARYSAAEDYPAVATAAIRQMYAQSGPPVLEDGLMKRGVIIRHLLLPGGLAEAKAVMDWVKAEFPPGGVLFSLMGQYTPMGRSADFPEIHRPLRPSEYRAAETYMADLGLTGFTQDLSSARSDFTPTFDLTGIP